MLFRSATTGENTEFETRMNHALAEIAAYEPLGLVRRENGGYLVTPLGQLFVRNLAMPFDRYLAGQQNVQFSKTV